MITPVAERGAGIQGVPRTRCHDRSGLRHELIRGRQGLLSREVGAAGVFCPQVVMLRQLMARARAICMRLDTLAHAICAVLAKPSPQRLKPGSAPQNVDRCRNTRLVTGETHQCFEARIRVTLL